MPDICFFFGGGVIFCCLQAEVIAMPAAKENTIQ
jgi:hypothetical protein